MTTLAAIVGIVLIVGALADAFEVVLLPRPIKRRFRLTRLFFGATWTVWARCAYLFPSPQKRESFISVYGPLSMVLLLCLWATCLIYGFGLVQWACDASSVASGRPHLFKYVIDSGATFFTLGYAPGDALRPISQILIIVEAGTGFGFIALTVSYLPVLYHHFLRRDMQLIQLIERAGSPPTAANVYCYFVGAGRLRDLEPWLREWELWAAELLESHNAYPMLAYYRSQHEGISWLASLGVILDCCAIAIAGIREISIVQATATFTVARRVLTEMSGALGVQPTTRPSADARESLRVLAERLRAHRVPWPGGSESEQAILALRSTYEPALTGLSTYLSLPLADWSAAPSREVQNGDWRETVIRLTNTL